MDSQWSTEVQAWGYTQSFQYTFPPESAIVQISLSNRYDYDNWAVALSYASASFTAMTADGKTTYLLEDFGITSSFAANNLTDFEGLLITGNCYAQAIINVFVWPSVYMSWGREVGV